EVTSNGDYLAATRFGIYKYIKPQQIWIKCQLPKNDEFVTGIEIVDSTIYITTRNSLYTAKDSDGILNFTKVELIPPTGSKPNMSIFRLFWIIHSGEILGISGRVIVDIVGLIMLFLSITGLIYFISPKIVKRVKGRYKLRRTKQATKFSYKWHLKVGAISAFLLLIVSFTGIFLRPPFLLFVVNGSINHSENSAQKNDIFWHDKIRDIKFDKARNLFLIATSDGIFYGKELKESLCKFKNEPPISVMGINVFEILENGDYLIGSFSGAFQWNPTNGTTYNYITGQEVVPAYSLSSPFGSVAVSGYSKINNDEYFFDYDKGVLPMRQNLKDIAMPKLVKDSFRFPLWNLTQEFHTCRIYSPIISSFYILIVPLAGISLIIITITGFAMWFIRRKGKRQQTQL
ncbi:MAG TPA: PepSY-associated TM helix domain-containing protein, partial [Tenuifilaceae bacterium]|nr:PepSY-associated TM helix domain-containing protein [Tenuifilaceae bacterium]